MSASQWDWSPASASGLLTNEECCMLLDADDVFNNDLLKSFPSAAAKVEPHKYQSDDVSSLYPPSPPDTKPSRAELTSDLLQQLDSQCKQENIFSNWLEEKVDLPIFENIPFAERVEVSAGGAYPSPQPTEELLREFESVYGAVELTHLRPPHLTPPQSPPPLPATQLLVSYAQAQCVPPAPAPATQHWPAAAYDPELQVVEELVRQGAQHLPSPARSDPPSSPHSSASSSPRSTDDEWSSPSTHSTPSTPSRPKSYSRSTDDEWSSPSSHSTRPKPYSRSSDDRRSRKKEQNKNAATRYRQKKKAEIEVLLGEESNLRQRHTDLGEKCSDLQREIKYLKGLMRDLFKAKGLIK